VFVIDREMLTDGRQMPIAHLTLLKMIKRCKLYANEMINLTVFLRGHKSL
jgi:hypothetical protein